MQALNWNDVRVFVAVADAGSLGAAGRNLGLDPTTLGRRLRRLEAHLEATLFERTRNGQELTEAGEALLAKARAMALAAGEIDATLSQQAGLSGTLRISVSEGFGSLFLTDYLAQFVSAHPALAVELVANSGFLSPSKREADIAVMLSRPKAGPVICRKLAEYRLMLYASEAYLARAGTPQAPANLAEGHTLVSYVPDLIYAPELDYLGEIQPGLTAQLRSSSINAQARLIANGAGAGVLPCFIGDAIPGLRRVCTSFAIRRNFWIVTHRDTHKLARIEAGKTWLLDCVRDGRERLDPD